MTEQKNRLYRSIPAVDVLLADEAIQNLLENWRRELVHAAVDYELERLRERITAGDVTDKTIQKEVSGLPSRVNRRLENWTRPSFQRVINATGIVVHTNLGRSLLPPEALQSVADLASRYMTLEFDIHTGKRGQRDAGIRRLLGLLFPGRSALVVNNNAAAVLLALNTLAEGREVLISRGRIIEIGDGFRINQIQEKSGAILREIGTTNRTHLNDYAEACDEHTALLLSVHPSNYRVVGFTAEPELADLVKLGREKNIPVFEDWGSGALVSPESLGIAGEQSAEQILASGLDAICFSGDKLLGGPQAGIIIGNPECIDAMRRNHLYRALRVDKMTLLALESVISAYLHGAEDRNIPTIRMLKLDLPGLMTRARNIVKHLPDESTGIVESSARVGGGAAPEIAIPSVALAITAGSRASELQKRLRQMDPPVIARVQDDTLLLDLRTVQQDEDSAIAVNLKKLLS